MSNYCDGRDQAESADQVTDGLQMSVTHFQLLYRSLNIIRYDGFVSLGLPTSEALDAYEVANRFTLPHSYRDFILAFGPGTLGHIWEIAAPGYPDEDWTIDLDKANVNIRERFGNRELCREYYRDVERICRMVWFAHFDSDAVGWDPEDVRNRETNEYGIYRVERDWEEPYELAGSFRDFVEEYCLGPKFFQRNANREEGPTPSKWEIISGYPQRSFIPACRPVG